LQTLIYSVIGSVLFLVAWAVPSVLIKPAVPRWMVQFFALLLTAYLLPSPSEQEAAFVSGQYAFVGGVVLIGAWQLIRKVLAK
jgi:uncharacterized membrane protein YeaQ/YmgE (transglycosylase-associated protein family)